MFLHFIFYLEKGSIASCSLPKRLLTIVFRLIQVRSGSGARECIMSMNVPAKTVKPAFVCVLCLDEGSSTVLRHPWRMLLETCLQPVRVGGASVALWGLKEGEYSAGSHDDFQTTACCFSFMLHTRVRVYHWLYPSVKQISYGAGLGFDGLSCQSGESETSKNTLITSKICPWKVMEAKKKKRNIKMITQLRNVMFATKRQNQITLQCYAVRCFQLISDR